MVTDWISREVCRLERKYNEPDPLALCERMGILVLFQPMGTYTGACKGFFLSQSRMRSITINSDLPEPLQRVIAAHELGHAVLHRKEAGVCQLPIFPKARPSEAAHLVSLCARLLRHNRPALLHLQSPQVRSTAETCLYRSCFSAASSQPPVFLFSLFILPPDRCPVCVRYFPDVSSF